MGWAVVLSKEKAETMTLIFGLEVLKAGFVFNLKYFSKEKATHSSILAWAEEPGRL